MPTQEQMIAEYQARQDQVERDQQQNAYNERQILDQQKQMHKDMRELQAARQNPRVLGKYGASIRRAPQAQQQMTPEILQALLNARAQQEAQMQPEQAPEEPRFTKDTLAFPSMYLAQEVQRVRNKARGIGNTGGSMGNTLGGAYKVLGAAQDLWGKTANGERKKTAVEELWGSRFSNGGGQG